VLVASPAAREKKRVGSNRTKIPACLAPKVSVPKAQSQAAYLASTSSHTRPRFHRKAQSVQSPVIPYTRLWVPPRLACLALALALWLFASQSRLSLVLKKEKRDPFHFLSRGALFFPYYYSTPPLQSQTQPWTSRHLNQPYAEPTCSSVPPFEAGKINVVASIR
jgi:hypothetical protein